MEKIDGVINLKDMFAEVKRKALWIVALGSLCAIILAGYAITINKANENVLEEVVSELTEEQITAVEEYVFDVREAEAYEKYVEESIIMECNPYEVYRTELQYNITANEDDIVNLRSFYIDYVKYGRLASDVASASKKFANSALLEIISTDDYVETQDSTLSVVSIIIFTKDETQAKELKDSVKTQMSNYEERLKDKLVNHQLELLEENTMPVIRADLMTRRIDSLNYLNNLKQTTKNEEAQFNNLQIDLANELLEEERLVVKKTELVEDKSVNVLLYTMLGLIVGMVIAVALIICVYFFSDDVKTQNETEALLGIKYLGNCSGTNSEASNIIANIVDFCKKNDLKSIEIVGKVNSAQKRNIDNVVESLCAQGIRTNYSESVGANDNVIIVEVLRQTRNEYIKAIYKECQERGKMLYGYIVISK